jgi:hypothetical protein
MSTAAQIISALVHAGGTDEHYGATVLIETPDGDIVVAQNVDYDDEFEAIVIQTSAV